MDSGFVENQRSVCRVVPVLRRMEATPATQLAFVHVLRHALGSHSLFSILQDHAQHTDAQYSFVQVRTIHQTTDKCDNQVDYGADIPQSELRSSKLAFM